ncbi:MAG: hypothetical protein M3R59_06480 [Verrucomicrobiota bacterium]|nr:hypothetical protein [Verrucomicrobiota bacterium]
MNATFDRDGALRSDSYSIAPINFKVRLLNNVDLQCILETYTHAHVGELGLRTVEPASGFGVTRATPDFNLFTGISLCC